MYIMTEPYTETILVTCDRESAKTKTDDGLNSTWTNDFNNTIRLNPGDRVSVYNSFVAERGSATPDSVEFKGVKLDKQKTITYTTLEQRRSQPIFHRDTFIIPVYQEIITKQEEVVDLQDNKASVIINYYKNADCLSYYQLPRRFIAPTPTDPDYDKWFEFDSTGKGRLNREDAILFDTNNLGVAVFRENYEKYGLIDEDYIGELHISGDAQNINAKGRVRLWKTKNDNSRYTIMGKTNTILTRETIKSQFDDVPPFFPSSYPPYYARDPEWFDYKIIREKIDLEVEPGFSSANYVAEEISKQLQQSEEIEDEEYLVRADHGGLFTASNLVQKSSKVLKSNTYKPFNSSNDYLNTQDNYNTCLNNETPNPGANFGENGPTQLTIDQLGNVKANNNNDKDEINDYYKSYQYIGCKRPEIYETGSELNDIFGFKAFTPETPIEQGITEDESHRHGIILYDFEYNQTNLTKLKNFIDSQAKYPELFSPHNIFLIEKQRYGVPIPDGTPGLPIAPFENIYMRTNAEPYINVNNARFFHINDNEYQYYNNLVGSDINFNKYATDIEEWAEYISLGCSYYDWRGGDPTNPQLPTRALNELFMRSKPFFFYYDPDYKDTYFDNPYGSDFDPVDYNNHPDYNISQTPKPKLTYGCFGKDPVSNSVVIYPCMLQGREIQLDDGTNTNNMGLPPQIFRHQNQAGNDVFQQYNKFGFDRHWNAWGTSMINLTTGIPNDSFNNPYPNTEAHAPAEFNGTLTQFGRTFPDVADPKSNTNPLSIFTEDIDTIDPELQKLINKQYLGADNPQLIFDGNHFVFEGLHTPLNKGNLNDTDDPPDGREADVVYKINPSQKYDNWSPIQFPYEEAVGFDYTHKAQGEPKQSDVYVRMNRNLVENTIYDGTTGIFIEDFGFNKDSWEQGFWGRLGFSYSQFNSGVDKSDRNTRISSVIDKTNILTTNAEIDMRDTKGWNQNKFGNPRFDGKILHPYQFYAYNLTDNENVDGYLKFLPEIVVGQTPIQIVADEYPVQLNNGYYGIRSDIISNSINALGDGNVSYPLVSISDKINSVKDFYISSPSSVQHTITKPTIVSSITTKITDPDGSLSRCSKRSVVIYKVEKERVIKDLLTEMRMKFEKEEMDKK